VPGHIVGVEQEKLCLLRLSPGRKYRKNRQDEKGYEETAHLKGSEIYFLPKFHQIPKYSFQDLHPFFQDFIIFSEGPGRNFRVFLSFILTG